MILSETVTQTLVSVTVLVLMSWANHVSCYVLENGVLIGTEESEKCKYFYDLYTYFEVSV